MPDQLHSALAEAGDHLNEARAHAAAVKKALSPKEWAGVRIRETKGIYNALERQNALRWKLAFPAAEYLYDVKVVGLTDAPEFAWPPRTYDGVQIKNNAVQPVEMKAPAVVPDSVKGGLSDDDILVQFREKTSLAKAIGKEKSLIRDAAQRGARIILEGRDVVTNSTVRIWVDPENLEISRVVRYGELPDKHLLTDITAAEAGSRGVAEPGMDAPQARTETRSTVAENRAVGVSNSGLRGDTGGGGKSGVARGLAEDRVAFEGVAADAHLRARGVPRRAPEIASVRKAVPLRGRFSQIADSVFSELGGVLGWILMENLINWLADTKTEDIQRLMMKLEPEIRSGVESELRSMNRRRFEKENWVKVVTIQTWYPRLTGIVGVADLQAIVLQELRIVEQSAKSQPDRGQLGYGGCVKIGVGVLECTHFRPLREWLNQGQMMAASGYRIQPTPLSHGVTQQQWLRVIRDYIGFALQYPDMEDLAQEAWARSRLLFCAEREYHDLFTQKELEACRDELYMLRLGSERGTHSVYPGITGPPASGSLVIHGIVSSPKRLSISSARNPAVSPAAEGH